MEALKLNERERLVVYEDGYEMGRMDAERSVKTEIAKKLLADGFSAEQVAKWTGLSESEICIIKN